MHLYTLLCGGYTLYMAGNGQSAESRPLFPTNTRMGCVPLILAGYPKSMIEIYLFCQTHAYLDLATLSSDKDFYGFRSCQDEGRVACGLAIRIFIAPVTAFRAVRINQS